MGKREWDDAVSDEVWGDEAEPPRWLGQQAGCVVAVFVGVVGVSFIAIALAVMWTLLHGG